MAFRKTPFSSIDEAPKRDVLRESAASGTSEIESGLCEPRKEASIRRFWIRPILRQTVSSYGVPRIRSRITRKVVDVQHSGVLLGSIERSDTAGCDGLAAEKPPLQNVKSRRERWSPPGRSLFWTGMLNH